MITTKPNGEGKNLHGYAKKPNDPKRILEAITLLFLFSLGSHDHLYPDTPWMLNRCLEALGCMDQTDPTLALGIYLLKEGSFLSE